MPPRPTSRGMPPVIVVTGTRGGGKTTLCRRISIDSTIVSRGVVSMPSYDSENRRTGIIATILPEERHVPLAVVVDPSPAPPDGAVRTYNVTSPDSGVLRWGAGELERSFDTGPLEDETDLFIGPYRFFARTFETVNATARQTITRNDSVEAPEVTLIDEIGPLEITQHRGFYPLLDAALGDQSPLVVTTRDGLVGELRRLADRFYRRSVVFEIDESTSIATVAEQIVTLCIQECGDE